MANKTRTAGRRPRGDPYMDLIHRFPLRPIKNDGEHELMGRVVDGGTGDYLDTLILLVNKYEDESHTPGGVDLSPQDALRAIMASNDMSQAQMGKVIGSESAVSMFINGERELSKAHIKALVARFRVDAGLFI
jgi:antitoxin component HigA of HigAB toxin-antitoxin module